MEKINLEKLEKLTKSLIGIKKEVGLYTPGYVELAYEANTINKRTYLGKIGEIDLSEEAKELNEIINDALNKIEDKMNEIYKNAVDDREGYDDDDCCDRALWLDEVQMSVSNLRHDIRGEE